MENMDNVDNAISELREKVSAANKEREKVNRCFKEAKVELSLKRIQVTRLRKELDAMNMSLFDLTRNLEMTKISLKQSEMSLYLARNKSLGLETKVKEMSELHVQLKIQDEIVFLKTKILNENVKHLIEEKQQLTHELSELQDQLRFCTAMQTELEGHQARINVSTAKTRDNMKILEHKQSEISELTKKLKSSQDAMQHNLYLCNEIEKLKRENLNIETAILEMKTKDQTLTSLMAAQKYFDFDAGYNLSRLNFLRWRTRCKNLQKKRTTDEATIASLIKALNQQMEVNVRLVEECEKLEEDKQPKAIKKEPIC